MNSTTQADVANSQDKLTCSQAQSYFSFVFSTLLQFGSVPRLLRQVYR